jgi:hypothetical protein
MPICPRTRKDRDQLSAAYAKLKKESSEFLKLKKRHQQVTADLEAEKTLSAPSWTKKTCR